MDGKEIKRTDRDFKFFNEETRIYNLSIKNKSVRIFTEQNLNIDDIIRSDVDYSKMMRLINIINADNMIMFKSSAKKKLIPASKKVYL